MEDIQLQLFDDMETDTVGVSDIPDDEDPEDRAFSLLCDVQRVALPILSLRSFSVHPLSQVTEQKPTLLTEHTMIFITDGTLSCMFSGVSYTARAGDCLYASPGTLFSRPENPAPAAYLTITFWDDTPQKSIQAGDYDTIFSYPHKMTYADDADVSGTVSYIHRICGDASPDQRKKLLAALQMLLVQMEDFVKRSSDNDYVRAMKRYLFAHYREGVKLEALSQEIGLHPVYCAKVFRKSEGISIGAFINRLRIDRATSELESALETSDVARDLGLSEFYFSRWFRRMTGVTPTEYRASLRSASVKR